MNITFCQTCVTGYYLYQASCYLVCPNSTYHSSTNCVQCSSSCSLCQNLTYCTSCNSGYSMQNNNCVSTCSQGISYNQICYPCGLNCDVCSTACTKCTTGYNLYNGYCISVCPLTTVAIAQVCQPCSVKYSSVCNTCNDTQCLSCTQGALINGICTNCKNG
jgi:proprotein convertase subtilisin/kexin type 5